MFAIVGLFKGHGGGGEEKRMMEWHLNILYLCMKIYTERYQALKAFE
jgi:hypothetical protein